MFTITSIKYPGNRAAACRNDYAFEENNTCAFLKESIDPGLKGDLAKKL